MKIVIAGGSGQVGAILQRAWAPQHQLVVLSRSPQRELGKVRFARWDGETTGPWVSELDGADVLINLAGRSVNCRYNEKNRREIIDSRVKSTQALGAACAKLNRPPRLWLQASTATIYRHVVEPVSAEDTRKFWQALGGRRLRMVSLPEPWRFSEEVARRWEAAMDQFKLPKTRKVKLRSAMIMSPDRGGVFDTLLKLVKWRVGGQAADGRQYVSWIHERDFIRALEWIIEREEFYAQIDIAAPHPLPNKDFMRELRAAAGVRFGLSATNRMLEVGAFFMRTETELILKGRHVLPGWLLRTGFHFEFPHWAAAARDLCARSARFPAPKNSTGAERRDIFSPSGGILK